MSLQKAILPDYVLANLYADCLVGGSPGHPDEDINYVDQKHTLQAPATAVRPYRFLGKNDKHVSVIAGYSDDPYMPEDHLEFLIKILAACKLNLGDVAILNFHEAGIEISKLKKELTPANILMFGIEPSQIGLPLSFPMFKPQLFDGTNFLSIPPISELTQEADIAKSNKKQLWECLKKIFLS